MRYLVYNTNSSKPMRLPQPLFTLVFRNAKLDSVCFHIVSCVFLSNMWQYQSIFLLRTVLTKWAKLINIAYSYMWASLIGSFLVPNTATADLTGRNTCRLLALYDTILSGGRRLRPRHHYTSHHAWCGWRFGAIIRTWLTIITQHRSMSANFFKCLCQTNRMSSGDETGTWKNKMTSVKLMKTYPKNLGWVRQFYHCRRRAI